MTANDEMLEHLRRAYTEIEFAEDCCPNTIWACAKELRDAKTALNRVIDFYTAPHVKFIVEDDKEEKE